MYKLAHFLRDHLPFIWDLVEWLNGLLFTVWYGRKMKALPEMLSAASKEYKIAEMPSLRPPCQGRKRGSVPSSVSGVGSAI